MSKNKQSQRNMQPQNVSITFPENISKADMIDILSAAIVKAEEIKAEKDAERKKQEDDQWNKEIGLKDYSDKSLIERIVLSFINTVCCLIRILFMPKKKITGNHATNGLIKLFVILLFRIVSILLWIFAIAGIIIYPIQSIFQIVIQPLTVSEYIVGLLAAVIEIVFAQMFRMAEVEIEKMEDKNYIVDIFAATVAVVAIVISLCVR